MKNIYCVEDKEGVFGFTMVELLVATAIIGILSSALMLMMEQINQTMRLQRGVSAQMVDTRIAAVSLENELRRLFKPELVSAIQPDAFKDSVNDTGWAFQGRNNSGGFVGFGSTEEYTECNWSDQDTLSSYISDAEGSVGAASAEAASDRRSNLLFIYTGEAETVGYIEECALLRRTRSHVLTHVTDSNDLFPRLDQDYDNVTGAPPPHGASIDRLMFRYYSAEAGEWYDAWDSMTSGDVHQYRKLPDAIEYAFRGFDPQGAAEPSWHRGMVNLNPRQ